MFDGGFGLLMNDDRPDADKPTCFVDSRPDGSHALMVFGKRTRTEKISHTIPVIIGVLLGGGLLVFNLMFPQMLPQDFFVLAFFTVLMTAVLMSLFISFIRIWNLNSEKSLGGIVVHLLSDGSCELPRSSENIDPFVTPKLQLVIDTVTIRRGPSTTVSVRSEINLTVGMERDERRVPLLGCRRSHRSLRDLAKEIAEKTGWPLSVVEGGGFFARF
ncbi:hypothetical protein Pla110_06230 [Polystyrenella longa]|uniref:Uncharacterized protein n=1 Tax=Polystyrenella longa TaxID=2528007 RepID=A0A518CI61_9PLAN|nr:hypothetical protein [Polystyrenella longa]QDU78919.1 hypothetical protein Pla110_06230 [Polystyrenella longa]